MTILQTGVSLPLNLKAGETLVIKELSGTSTVTGSVASREDASASIGAGFVVYGPQSSDCSVTISTTGACDWAVHIGDETPGTDIIRSMRKAGPVSVLDDISKSAIANSAGGFLNWKKSNTRQIRAALAGASSNDFRSRFVFLGDSMFAGTGANNNGLVGARAKGFIAQAATLLTRAGFQADENWSMGHGGAASVATVATYDQRMSFGSAVVLNSSYPGIGGNQWNTTTDTVNGTVTHTARKAFDTVDILAVRGATLGSFSSKDQASAVVVASTSTNGANGVIEINQTFPANSTAVTLTTTGTQCWFSGVGTRLAASPGIEMINCGISGIDLGYQTINPATGNNFAHVRAALPVLMTSATKNVVFITAGYNDIYSGFGRTLDQVAGLLRSQLTFLKGLTNVPDIVFMSYPNVGTITQAQQDTLNDTLINIAINEYDICVIDQRPLLETSATAVSLGLQAADALHNRAGGQAITAKILVDALMYSRSF